MSIGRSFLAVLAVTVFAVPITSATGFGVNAHIPVDAVADRIEDAGIEWVRIDFLWALVEPERDVYDWSIYDELVDRLSSRGLRIYAGLGATPAWATSGTELIGVPDDPDQWRELCYLAANRYAGRIEAWGLWNEPNQDHFWEGTRQQYIDVILLPGADAIALADPWALVCGPDLAHLSSSHWKDWMRDVISAARDVLDVVTHHAYPSDGRASEVTGILVDGDPYPFGDPSVKEVLQDEEWWPRPFWLTETGLESDRWGQATQADFVDDLLTTWFSPTRGSRDWVDRVFFYEITDGRAPSQYSFGLLAGPPDYDPKPSYTAYADFIAAAEVDDARIVGNMVPTFFVPGVVVNSSITLRNTGTTTWFGTDAVELKVVIDSAGWQLEVEQLGENEIVLPGATRTFAVTITGPGAITKSIGGQTCLTARMERVGLWPFGDMVRQAAVLVYAPPPEITRQPEGLTIAWGAATRLHIEAQGLEPLSYRWLRNGVEVADNDLWSGSSTANLNVSVLTADVEGFYQCEISNAIGTVVSIPAAVVIGTPAPRRGGGRARPDGEPGTGIPIRRPISRFSGPPQRR